MGQSTHSISALKVLAALLLAVASGAVADVPAGVEAWSKGNYAVAVREWQEPASKGDADALFNLGQAYKLGRGVPQDLVRAEDLFRQASAAGHLQAADTYGLLLFQRGAREKALPYLQAAIERGDPRAQYLLGVAHFNGDLVEKDWARAYALTTMAQHAGLPQAALAVQQMDQHISLSDRQHAATIAAELGERIAATRARQMAAAELGTGSTAGPAATRPVAPATAPAPPAGAQRQTPASAPAGNAFAPASQPWRVQLGVFAQPANLEGLWTRVKGRPELAGRQRLLVPAGRATRLLVAGFASQAEAGLACVGLAAAGYACLPVRN